MILAPEPTLRAAAEAHRKPFIFAREPLSSETRRSLAREYKNLGKPFLLSVHGEAGVYPAETHWLIPKNADGVWLRKHLAPLIATTKLFPEPREHVFFHSGDLGDIIGSLPAIRQLGGGRLVIGHVPHVGNRETMRGARFDAIRPLLEAQPYISSVEYDDAPTDVSHNISTFRHDIIRGESLAHWQARHLGISELNLEPWLSVPKVDPTGLVVMSRSLRYHNPFFPWPQIVHKYFAKMLWVGLPSEHQAMQKICGRLIPYQPTADLLELAQIIAGCELFIGNQSAPWWIAAGLGVSLIQESWEYGPNSVILRDNARYTLTGPETRTLIYTLK